MSSSPPPSGSGEGSDEGPGSGPGSGSGSRTGSVTGSGPGSGPAAGSTEGCGPDGASTSGTPIGGGEGAQSIRDSDSPRDSHHTLTAPAPPAAVTTTTSASIKRSKYLFSLLSPCFIYLSPHFICLRTLYITVLHLSSRFMRDTPGFLPGYLSISARSLSILSATATGRLHSFMKPMAAEWSNWSEGS